MTTTQGRTLQDRKPQPCNWSRHDCTDGCGCTAARHHTANDYDNHGCRCADARRASVRERAQRELRALHLGPALVPAVGAARRLRALAAIGWDRDTLAAHLGRSWQAMQSVRAGRQATIHRDTHRAVDALYRRLSDIPGPSPRAAAHAARCGWLPPVWWDDDTIDDPTHRPVTVERRRSRDDVDPVTVARAADGEDLPLTRGERYAVYRLLTERGVPMRPIAARFRLNGQTQRAFRERYAAEQQQRHEGAA